MSTPQNSQPQKRRAVTPEEKAHQRTLAKVKRLNMKLSKVNALSVNMDVISRRGETVPSKQVQQWVKMLKDILNQQEPKT